MLRIYVQNGAVGRFKNPGRGASSYVVGIICPPGWNDQPKPGRGMEAGALPAPSVFTALHKYHVNK